MKHSLGVDLFELPNELRSLVENELDRGEEIVWLDRPDPSAFTQGYWVFQLFGVPFTAFAVFWIVMAASMGGGLFPLFGIPFVVVGLGMLTSPYWGRRFANRSVYAITDRRAIVFKQEWNGLNIRSFRPEQLGELERTQRADGAGDLVFTREVTPYHGKHHSSPHISKIGFIGVARVKQVEDLIERLVASKNA